MIATPVARPIGQIHLAPGSRIAIAEVDWAEFEQILEDLGDHRSARIAYSHRTLEIMVPLPEHEKPKEILSDIIKILLRRRGQRYEPFGSSTFKRLGIAGIEPDACFYIQNYQRMISRRRLEPGDPPPDLAVESDVTSKTTLEAYQDLGVPELWIYDRRLRIYGLDPESRQYQPLLVSPTFPHLDHLMDWVSTSVERSWVVGTVQALEEFEANLGV